MSLPVSLGRVIRATGVKEFALRAIAPRHNPMQETLNWLLKPFKLRLSLAPIEPSKCRSAA